MGLKLNLKDVDVSKFEPVPAGTYDVKITGVEEKETSGTGKLGVVPMLNWEFTIQDAEDAKLNGRKLWTNAVIAPTTMFKLKSLLLVTGQFSEEELSSDDLEFEPTDLIGSELQVVVIQRDYEGSQVNDIKKFKALGGNGSSGSTVGSGKPSLLP